MHLSAALSQHHVRDVVAGDALRYPQLMEIAAHFGPNNDLATQLLCILPQGEHDSAHDIAHILRVWQNVRRIAGIEGGDLTVLTAATLLHDCVHLPKDAPDRHLASGKAADFAARELQALGWSDDDVQATAHAIKAHSFSANIPPNTLEAQILQDADRLDAIGHIGIARCFAVSGALGRALYDPIDPQALSRPLNDTAFAIDHFSTKLLTLADGFQTKTGRRLAAERHRTLKSFLSGFLNEVKFE